MLLGFAPGQGSDSNLPMVSCVLTKASRRKSIGFQVHRELAILRSIYTKWGCVAGQPSSMVFFRLPSSRRGVMCRRNRQLTTTRHPPPATRNEGHKVASLRSHNGGLRLPLFDTPWSMGSRVLVGTSGGPGLVAFIHQFCLFRVTPTPAELAEISARFLPVTATLLSGAVHV